MTAVIAKHKIKSMTKKTMLIFWNCHNKNKKLPVPKLLVLVYPVHNQAKQPTAVNSSLRIRLLIQYKENVINKLTAEITKQQL